MKQFRYYFLGIVILTGLFACESQKKVSDIIYDKYNGQAGFSMIALPPNFVDKFVDESEKEQKELLNQIRDFRLMIFDDKLEGKNNKSVYDEVNQMLNKGNFEELMSINKSGSKVTVKIRQQKDIVKEMHVLVKGENKFFIASLLGRINLNTITDAMDEINFNGLGDIKDFTDDFDFDDFNFDF